MSESLVRYGSFTEEGMDETAATAATLSNSNFAAIEVGDNVFRFIPPPVGQKTPFRVTALHYVPTPGKPAEKLVFACPRVELRQPCPVCAEAARLSRDPSPAARARGKELEPSMRVYANVIDRNAEDAGVKILGFGKQILDQLKSIRKNPRLGGDYTNPTEAGFDIVISRTGTGRNDTKYVVTPVRENSALAPTVEQMQELIDNQHDLEKQVDPDVPEQLIAAFEEAALRMHGREVAAQPPAQRVGAQLMGEVATPTATPAPAGDAVADAEFDDDFN